MLRAVLEDGFPWGMGGEVDVALELFRGVELGVINPLLLGEVVVVGADEVLAEVEGLNLLWAELASEDVKVFPKSGGEYTSESMLARNKLLFSCSSFAYSSLAPWRRPVPR